MEGIEDEEGQNEDGTAEALLEAAAEEEEDEEEEESMDEEEQLVVLDPDHPLMIR